MQVKINCTLDLSKGVVRIRHEVPGLEDISQRMDVFGFPAKVSPEAALNICDNLRTWILNRFKLEAEAAVTGATPKEGV